MLRMPSKSDLVTPTRRYASFLLVFDALVSVSPGIVSTSLHHLTCYAVFHKVHARRGDVLGQHVNYEGFSGPQMTNATSPQHIAEIVNIVAEDNETVLVFANEKNQTWFDELRAHVGGSRQIFFEADVIGLLPPARQSRFTDVYDFSLAFTEIQVSKLALST